MNEKNVIMQVLDLLSNQERFKSVLSRLNSPEEDVVILYENFWDENPLEMYRQLTEKYKERFIDAVAIECGLVMSPEEASEDEFCPVCGDFLSPTDQCLNCGWPDTERDKDMDLGEEMLLSPFMDENS